MNWNQIDWKIITAVYAAIVSTFVAIWRIYEYIDDRKGRITIKLITGSNTAITEFWDDEDKEFHITALITNVGKKSRYLKTPYFIVLPRMSIPEHSELLKSQAAKRTPPTQILPGEEIQYDIPMWLLVKYRQMGAQKMQVQVFDTHRKLYKSEWRKL